MAFISIFNNGSLGEEPTDASPQPAHNPAPATDKSAYLGYTPDTLRDLGCTAAMADSGLAPVVKRLETIEQLQHAAIQVDYNEKSSYGKEKLTRIQSERDAFLASIDPDAKRTTGAALRSELAERKAHISAIMLHADADQAVRELEEKRRLNQQRIELEEQELKARIARAEVVCQIHAQDRIANHDRFEQHATYLEERKKELQRSFYIALADVARLKELGISRLLAAFFIWASSASLVGTGVVAINFARRALRAAEERSEDSLLVSWLHNVHTPGDLLRLFSVFMGTVLAAVAIIALFTLCTRFILRRYDPAWQSTDGREDEPDEEWSDWLQIFSVSSRIGGRRISDYSLQQIVGVLPILVAAAVVAFLFVAFGDRSSSDLSFTASQIGPALVLLSLVSSALFITHVVSAVLAKRPLPLLLNILFGVIAILPPLSLGVSGFAAAHSGSLAMTVIAIAMTLASSGLVFGLMYRSQFLAVDSIERHIDSMESATVSLRATPTVRIALAQMGDDEERLQEHDHEVAVRSVQLFLSRITGWIAISWPRARMALAGNTHELEDSIRKLQISGPLLVELNEHRTECDRLAAAIAELEAWEKETQDIHQKLASMASKLRADLSGLSIERERALLVLENAFHIARANLGQMQAHTEEVAIVRASAK